MHINLVILSKHKIDPSFFALKRLRASVVKAEKMLKLQEPHMLPLHFNKILTLFSRISCSLHYSISNYFI